MSKISRVRPIENVEAEFSRIQSIRAGLKRLARPDSDGPRKGFVVSWYYPPTTAVRGIACHRLLKYSSNNYSVLFNNGSAAPPFNYGSNINPIPFYCNEYPYSDFDNSSWYDLALTTYTKLSAMEGIDFVFTNSVPIPEHRIGLEIKRRDPYEKWIAFFSDPMSNNDHFTFYKRAKVLKETNNKDWENQLYKEKNKMREYEINIFEKANLLLFPQETLAQFMMGDLFNQYKHKIGIVPHSFEKYADMVSCFQNDKITFSFVGSLYALQTINDLSKSIKLLKKRVSNLKDKITINIVGNVEDINLTTVKQDGVGDIINFVGEVTHADAIGWMTKSDYLISLQPRMLEKWLGFIRPAKLADYMSVKKPIILFGDGMSESEKFAAKSNNIFCLQSPELMADLFQAILEGRISASKINQDYYDEHLSSSVSLKLDGCIEKMLME